MIEQATERYGVGHEKLRAWALDEAHIVQSVRMHEPVYANPGELRADVRRLLAIFDAQALQLSRGDSRTRRAAEKLLSAWDMIGDTRSGNKQEAIKRRTEAIEELREALQ